MNPETVISPAILDRLLHQNHELNFRGENCRFGEKRQAGLFASHRLPTPTPGGGWRANTVTGQIGKQQSGGSVLTRVAAPLSGRALLGLPLHDG